ncbi:MAG: hypothetical protein AAB426_01935 [Myxococcota bacterium]
MKFGWRVVTTAVTLLVLAGPVVAAGSMRTPEQESFDATAPLMAAVSGGAAAIVVAGNVYAIAKGHRQVGWVIPGFVTAGFCAEFGLLSFMFGKVGAQYGAFFLGTSAVLTTVSWWNLRLPRKVPRHQRPNDGPDDGPNAVLVPTLLSGLRDPVPGLALAATW